jgi:hypothetical protein
MLSAVACTPSQTQDDLQVVVGRGVVALLEIRRRDSEVCLLTVPTTNDDPSPTSNVPVKSRRFYYHSLLCSPCLGRGSPYCGLCIPRVYCQADACVVDNLQLARGRSSILMQELLY